MTKYVEAAGLHDPLTKIYITSKPLDELPILLFLFTIACMPRLQYDKNFGCLVRRKQGDAIDGVPLIVGCSTVLRQFHPSYARKFLAYLGQFVRSNIDFTLTREASKLNDVPFEVMNCIIFVEQFCMFAAIPREAIEAYIPPYLFDNFSAQ